MSPIRVPASSNAAQNPGWLAGAPLANFFGLPITRLTLTPLPQPRQNAGALFVEIPELKGSVIDHKPIRVGNSSNATLSFSTDGRLWVRKHEVHTGCQPLLAEAVAWLMCRHIKISVPDAAFHVDRSGQRSWMSQFISGIKHWQPDYGNFIDNLEDVAGMLALDALLLNEDRHGANILAQASADGVSFKLWAIDFGNSLVGWIGDFEERGQDAPALETVRRQHAKGLPLEAIGPYLADPLKRLRELSPSAISAVAIAACEVAREPKDSIGRLSQALQRRCLAVEEIVQCYIHRLGKLP